MSQSTILTFFGKGKKPSTANKKRKTNPARSEEKAKTARKAFLDELFGEDSEKEDAVIDESGDNLSRDTEDIDAQLENVDSNSKQGNEPSIERKGPTRKFCREWIFDVRWLSRGNVMERLTQLMPAILSFWRTSAPSWYDKLRVYKVRFCIYMLVDVLKELNKLSILFQKDTLDISSISSSIENVLSGLRRKFLGDHFHKDTVYLKKFMESTNDGVLRHVNDSDEEYAHVLLYTSIPGKDKSRIPLDLDTGDVASCVSLAKMFVKKVIGCVNERFPDVYFFNAARLFCPRHYPRNAKSSHSSKEREEKVTIWLERLLVQFGCNLIDQQGCMEELFSFTDALYYECGQMGMTDAWQVFCSEGDWHRTYANMMKLWQIMLVLPVSSVSCERGFSKQNLIKVDSRRCLNVSTLEALMRISLLGPSPQSINWEEVHDIWKLVKAQRVCDL